MRTRTRREQRRTRDARSDSGITTLQVLIMFPIMVFVIGLSIQEALNYYAKQVALAAAQEGVDAVRYSGDLTPAQANTVATTAADAYLADHGGNLLTVNFVNATLVPRQPPPFGNATDQIEVEVSGTTISLIPQLDMSVDQIVLGPIEEFTVGLK